MSPDGGARRGPAENRGRRRGMDLSAVRLVAARELRVRGRDKSLIISTAITLLILTGVILVNRFFVSPPSFDVGVLGERARAPAEVARTFGQAQGLTIRLREVPDDRAANAGLRDGSLDAVLVQDQEIRVESDPSDQLVGVLQVAAQAAVARAALAEAGLDPSEIEGILNPEPLPVARLDPPDPNRDANSTVAFVAMLLLYGQIFGFGYTIAAGVVEEKSSRVVEILLATIRPSELLAGKILGIGALGFVQLVGMGVYVIVVAQVAGVLTVPSSAYAAAGLSLVWFLIGFAFYSTVFAVSGSIVSRTEELQNTMTPLSILLVASLLVAINVIGNPDSTLAQVASFLPPSAPLTMPPRLVLGVATWWEGLLSAALSLAATAALVPLAARLYVGSVLKTGSRVKLGEAWRAAA